MVLITKENGKKGKPVALENSTMLMAMFIQEIGLTIRPTALERITTVMELVI